MDSLSNSDLSKGMRELIEQGFAIRRGRERVVPESRQPGDPCAQVRDLDLSHVQRPLTLNVSAGVASTHGLTPATIDTVTAARRNIIFAVNLVLYVCLSTCYSETTKVVMYRFGYVVVMYTIG